MARPVDTRKTRGSTGVHTADEHVPLGKQDQGRDAILKGSTPAKPGTARGSPAGKSKHASGHEGQNAKRAKSR